MQIIKIENLHWQINIFIALNRSNNLLKLKTLMANDDTKGNW